MFAGRTLFGGVDPNDEIIDWPFQVYAAVALIYLVAIPVAIAPFARRAVVQALLGIAAFAAAATAGGQDIFGVMLLAVGIPASGLLSAPLARTLLDAGGE